MPGQVYWWQRPCGTLPPLVTSHERRQGTAGSPRNDCGWGWLYVSGKRLPLSLSFGAIPLWRDVRVLRALTQIVSAVLVVGLVLFIVTQVVAAANERGFSLGFDFLQEEAGFPIGESVIEYEESDSFLYAFGVGILNTLKVAISGVILATLLGTFLGICSVSTNWLVSRIATVYVEVFRNVPLLVQLFFWYFGVFQLLAAGSERVSNGPARSSLNNRGIYMVWGSPTSSFVPWLIVVLVAVVVAVVVGVVLSRVEARTGRSTYPLSVGVAIVVVIPALAWIVMPERPLGARRPGTGSLQLRGWAAPDAGVCLSADRTGHLHGRVHHGDRPRPGLTRCGADRPRLLGRWA